MSKRVTSNLVAYQAQIRKIVSDPARAEELVALTGEFQEMALETIASMKAYRAKAAALNSNYEATRADYETVFSQQDAAREAFVKKALTLRERMVALTTDAEWVRFGKARLRVLEADLQQLLS